MQFVKYGPNVPDKLIQAHEEGRVVFFCGAGISFPAGLPGFGKLVNSLYSELGVIPDDVQKQALKNGQFDTAVSLLESIKQTPEWRRDVREKLSELLKPDFSSPKSTQTHKSLLRLSTTNDKKMRLITTNFDTVFQKAAEEERIEIKEFSAPLLPVPKKRWDGLVYLHGLLPRDKNGLNHLVISSGDFGLAYLTERWAARFVSELFRTYTVCFIGYSLNDPVLRYMMDALAADKQLGESPPEMYAFGNYKASEYDKEEKSWRAKNVTPILYKNHSRHYYLHETLAKWAETYRDGLSGKEQIVVTTAYTNPMQSDVQNDYAKRLAWALSDPSGIPAKTFSKLSPPAPISWLKVLERANLNTEDLSRYGVIDKSLDEEGSYSIFNRPAKSSLTPNMTIAKSGYHETSWDEVMENLAKWLLQHINNPELILFVSRQGGRLNQQMKWLISSEIRQQDEKRKERDTEYFRRLSLQSSDRIVSSRMKSLWSIVLAGYTEQSGIATDFYSWVQDYKLLGVTVGLKKSLRRVLGPFVSFKEPFNFNKSDSESGIKGRIDWDVDVASSFAHSAMDSLNKDESWHDHSYELIQEFVGLLVELMEVKSTLGDINPKADYSYISRPSIKAHPQNNDYKSWTVLVDLVRDSWLSLVNQDESFAISLAEQFWSQPYPIFKRIALFCASESSAIPVDKVVSWLKQDDTYWLWNVSTHREVLQLLRTLHRTASNEQYEEILQVTINGPRREWYREELSEEEFEGLCNRSIWLRLKKLQQDGGALNDEATQTLADIENINQKWKLSNDDRDEFPFWTGRGDEPKSIVSAPKEKLGLIEWLKEEQVDHFWTEDDWSTLCRDDFELTSSALKETAASGMWLSERWRQGIQVWSEAEDLDLEKQIGLFKFVLKAPDEKLVEIAWSLSRWLKKLQPRDTFNDNDFLYFYDRLLNLPYETDNGAVTINTAINHPVGMLVESLFSWWYTKKPYDDEGLDEEFQNRLEVVCDLDIDKFSLGRVIVCSNVLSIYRVDQAWAREHIISWLSWDDINTSSMAWQSLLWSPRLHKGFIYEIRDYLINTAKYYDYLGELKSQYVTFMTHLSLQGYSEFKVGELAKVFNTIPNESLYHAASALKDILSSSGEKVNEFWQNRAKPFLTKVWPKQAKVDDNTVTQLALICIAAKENFNEAYKIIRHNLKRQSDAEYITRTLEHSGLIEIYPQLALDFLDSVIGEPKYYSPTKLVNCLDKIAGEEPEVINNPEFVRLKTITNKF